MKIGHMDDPVAIPDSGTLAVRPGTGTSKGEDHSDSKDNIHANYHIYNEIPGVTDKPSEATDKPASIDEFNLKDNQKELDTSFWTCFVAVLFKRTMNYRRNKKAIFNEVVIPALIVLFGFGITKLQPAWRSDSRI